MTKLATFYKLLIFLIINKKNNEVVISDLTYVQDSAKWNIYCAPQKVSKIKNILLNFYKWCIFIWQENNKNITNIHHNLEQKSLRKLNKKVVE